MLTTAEAIWSSPDLPTLPSVAVRLLEISKQPETEIKDVVNVIQSDPAIAARILKAANSSFFGLRSRVTSIDNAVMLLGTTVVTSLALSFSLVQESVGEGSIAGHYHSYWTQSTVQAVAAEKLAKHCPNAVASEFFLTGLLADIGRLAMLRTISDEYVTVSSTARDEGRSLREVELEVLGFDHVEIGTRLMENWGLPTALVDAVRYHHSPLTELTALRELPHLQLVKSIALASSVGDYFGTQQRGLALDCMREQGEELFGLDESDLDKFLCDVHARAEEAAEVLSITTEKLGDPRELMDQANKQLAELALRAHAASAQLVAQNEVLSREKQELQCQNQQLHHKAMNDRLTQVYNRYFFDEVLQAEVCRCARNQTSVGLIFVDIDHFKNLNDTYGHQFGDLVLQRVAARLNQSLRKSDVIARYGGEEFVILAIETNVDGLHLIAERLRTEVAAEEIYSDEQRVHVTISVGGSIGTPKRGAEDFAQLLVADADAAMYDSKHAGRNQTHVRRLENRTVDVPTLAAVEAGSETAIATAGSAAS